jgi:glycosyltransferase involved in cell wall biosynthesis
MVSISRLTASKGVLLLSSIDDQLLALGVQADWIIIGSGELEGSLKEQWKDKPYVRFHSPAAHEEVLQIAATGDVFVSPSIFEGYGIALLEAMSCGLVPVIYRLPVGVYSNLPGSVGFSVELDHIEDFAGYIARLDQDRGLLAAMSDNTRSLVIDKYDISKTAGHFLEYFKANTAPLVKKQPWSNKADGLGILDRPYIPNSMARWLRKIKTQ